MRSQWTWLPRPTGTPQASTSTSPPSESPSLAAALISVTMASAVTGIDAAHLGGVDGGLLAPFGPAQVGQAGPADLHRRATARAPPARPSSALASAPAATRAAVSRAEARSSTSRASRQVVLLHARQIGVARAGAWSAGRAVRPGAALISSCHLSLRFHSLLATSMATGEPERAAVADAAEEGHLVLLEAHAGTPAVAEPAAGQLVADLLDRDAAGPRADPRRSPRAPGRGTRRRSGSATSRQAYWPPGHGLPAPAGRQSSWVLKAMTTMAPPIRNGPKGYGGRPRKANSTMPTTEPTRNPTSMA